MPDPEGTITSADAIVQLVVRKYHGEKDIGDLVKTPEKYFAFGDRSSRAARFFRTGLDLF